MKRLYLLSLLCYISFQAFATGEPSTYFNIFIAPNNDPVQRNAALIITAIYDSTSFEIIDDDMDGDSDDSFSGLLMAGQSYILYIKDNGINDDAKYASGGVLKQDGDYFIITSDKLVYASQSTDSDWQHDWVPATNKTSKGERFIVYAPKISSSNRDLNVFAYEDETTVTVRKISTGTTLQTGYTNVDIKSRETIIQRTMNIGQDLINYFTDGQNVMESGHTYLVESNKPVTVQYGALHHNARDGGGYVPSSTGGSSGELFYFSVPYQAGGEQEIRIVSIDDDNDVYLERYSNGNWVALKNWTLDSLNTAEWVGKKEGNVTYPTVFKVTCTAGKKVLVLEANWMETGSPGTSDMATMVTSMSGKTAGKEFLVYLPPPGWENNVINPFTGNKFTAASHAYLFAFNKDVTVTVKDAYTQGQSLNRTYQIEKGRYADFFLELEEWKAIYNGDGNPDSGPERPYVIIEADQNISVMVSNFNDNWMNYFGSSLEQSFSQSSTTPSSKLIPGDTVTVQTVINNESDYDITEANIKVLVPDGLTPLQSTLTNLTTLETDTATFTQNSTTGENTGTFDEVTNLSSNTNYEVSTLLITNIQYYDGEIVSDNTVLSVETVTSGSVNDVFQSSSSAVGLSNNTSNTSNLLFEHVEDELWTGTLTDSWTANWVDYDNDNDLDLFVTDYDKNTANLLYENTGNGNFSRIQSGNLVSKSMSTVASSWADYDNDGDLDVALANNIGSQNALYKNEGAGVFTNENASFTKQDGYHHGVSWIDINNDGFLDVYFLDFLTVNFNLLYLNSATTFDLSQNTLLSNEAKRSIGAMWADYDNDGWQDVFVPNGSPDGEGQNNTLFHNLGNGKFEKISTGTIVNDGANSVAATWGDYDNDGYLDLFVANASDQPNYLYKNNGDGSFSLQSIEPFLSDRGNSHGCTWFDYDNDADLDLLVINNSHQPNFLYRNNGDGSFTSIINEIIATNLDNAMGVAVADMDKDGDLDAFIPTFGHKANHLFKNKGSGNNWVSIKLVGTSMNKSAIGAKVKVKANINGTPIWQTRFIASQNGLGGQNSLNLHLGLGNATSIDSVEVEWHPGKKQWLTQQSVNQEITIVESSTSSVSGIVFIDTNANCNYDNNEETLSGIKVISGDKVVYSDAEGQYTLNLIPGSHTIQVESDKWSNVCSDIQVDVIQSGTEYNENSIAVQALSNHFDRSVTLGCTAMRKGFKNTITIVYSNNGTVDVTEDTLSLTFDELVIPVSSSVPWSGKTGNRYYWVLDTLRKGETHTIEIVDSVSVSAQVGDPITLTANFANQGDYNTEDDQFTLNDFVVGAVDPNDIQASPVGIGENHVIDNNQEITYKIRFQNTGNYFAQNVIIEDQLPESLDLNTFKMISSSHAFELSIEDRKLIWLFKDIHLPDSAQDVLGSQGFITFSIQPSENNAFGTEIFNNAAITFDYEKPLVTNTVKHTVIKGNRTLNNHVKIFPNPMQGYTTLSLVEGPQDISINKRIKKILIMNSSGQVILDKNTNNHVIELYKGLLTPGMYFVVLTNAHGYSFKAKLIVE
ncbi:FG-GAP-like repeat-containing protein [Rapidithrix thailandica]|uniref:FG-GAP-like repeat-containing protein n=1 Tax=Rapidithrix thailandica TaxID=413964 RepID=A0AAW9S9Z8_9BACT